MSIKHVYVVESIFTDMYESATVVGVSVDITHAKKLIERIEENKRQAHSTLYEDAKYRISKVPLSGKSGKVPKTKVILEAAVENYASEDVPQYKWTLYE